MNRKQFVIVLVALATIGSAGLVLFKRNQQSWTVRETNVGDKLLPDFRFNDVAAIHIKGGKADFNVERRDGQWRLRERNDYPADYTVIKDLLLKIKDLKVARSENIGPSQLANVGLEQPGKADGGTLIEFKDAQGQLLNALLVGKRHLRPESSSDPFRMRGLFDGCYVLLPHDPQNVLLISDDLATVTPEPGAWLDRSFVKIENVRSILSVGDDGKKQWELARENASQPWSLRDLNPGAAETPDASVVAQTVEMLPFLTFMDVAGVADSPEQSPTADKSKSRKVFIRTFDSFFYVLDIAANSSGGNYRLTLTAEANISSQPAEEPAGANHSNDQAAAELKRLRSKVEKERAFTHWTYLVDSSVIAPLMRERAQFIQSAKVAVEQNAVAKKDALTE